MTPSKKILSLVAASFVLSSMANAGSVLVGSLTADDTHTTYISTADNVAGTALVSNTGWSSVETISATLMDGQDYYLHIYAKDIGGSIAGFLGEFSLTGNHTFANGTQSLLTNVNDWQVSTSGWGNYGAVTNKGLNGDAVYPWNTTIAGIDSNANWIWTGDTLGKAYFTVKIEASEVPVPAAAWLFGSAVLGLVSVKRKKA